MLFRYWFLIFICSFGYAQITDFKDLEKTQINGIVKDELGRMWFATASGIYSYDGSVVFKFSSNSNSKKLESESINGIVYNAVTKKIIATSNNGLYSIDPASFEIKMRKLNLQNTFTDENYFYNPCTDTKGNVWLANKTGFLIKLSPNLVFTKYYIKLYDSKNYKLSYEGPLKVEGLSIVENKLFYFNSRLTLCQFDIQTLKNKTLSEGCRGFAGAMLFDNSLAFIDFYGAHVRGFNDTVDKKYSPITLITASFQDAEGNIWFILDRTKLCKLNKQLGYELILELNQNQINERKMFTTIFADADRIWLGTIAGYIVINKPNPAFERILRPLKDYEPNELSSRGIVSANDTTIICSGYNYIAQYHTKRKTIEPIVTKEIAKGLLSYGLFCAGDSLWIAGEGSGLNLINYKTRKFQKIKYSNSIANHQYLNKGLLRNIARIDSNIFAADYGFLFKYNIYSNRVDYCDSPAWPYRYFNNYSRAIIQIVQIDKNKILFVSEFKVYITDKYLRLISKIDLNEGESLIKSEIKILNALLDKEGCFWLSTEKNGVCRYDPKKGNKIWYNKNNGLCDNTVYFTLQSNDGKIWAATNHGLSDIDLNSNVVNNYFEEDGIANNEFNTNSYYKAKNGDLYMGGMKGVTRIVPSLLKPKYTLDAFVFSLIKIVSANKSDSLIFSGLSDSMKIELPNHSRFLNVKFSLTNFSTKNRYEFRLSNSDTVWANLGDNNFINFNSLDPGLHTLQIRAWDARGFLAPKVLTLFIDVEQIFYLKWWFILIVITTFVLITGLIFYIIYKNKIEGMNRIAQMRLKIATDLHDQVGGLLNKAASQAELAKQSEEKDYNTLNKIADNSRTALNSMRDILWNLDPRNDNSESLVRRMSEYAYKMLEDTNDYELNLAELKKLEMSLEVRQTINLVFNEAINNIVKHAPNQKVEIKASKNISQLELMISNTGKFKLSEEYTGQGLKNMKMRIENIGGSFIIVANDKVTLFFKIPLKSLNSY